MISVCPCDDHDPMRPDNPPGLTRIVARRDDWRSIRRALVVPRAGELSLNAWRPAFGPDLALMMAEWWAILGEVLEFYNDELANEAFLRTARRRESVTRLVSLLGYRPRPALAATVTLAAIVEGRDTLTLPRGFAVESVPPPGKQAQTFELDSAAVLQPGGRTRAQPAAALVAPDSGVLLLEGKVRNVAKGDLLRLRAPGGHHLLTVTGVTVDGGVTRLAFTASPAIPATTSAADCRIERPVQSLPAWTVRGSAMNGEDLHLAAMTRSISAGDTVLLTAPGKEPQLQVVTGVADAIWYANAADESHPETAPGPPDKVVPLPVPHSVLTLSEPPPGWLTLVDINHNITIWMEQFFISQKGNSRGGDLTAHFGWVALAPLTDQPPAAWTGTPTSLSAIAPGRFPESTGRPVLVADPDGIGVPAALTAGKDALQGDIVIKDGYADDVTLAAPLDILTRLLPMTRGKTVAAEVLGSGNARLSGQSFTLAKSPVSYVRRGAGFASNVTILVNGVPWTEVDTLYGQPADAAVYTLRENEDGKTVVMFGHSLPTGKDNVVARYRYGAGAEAPGAGKLTRISKPMTGLARLLNPVAASSGADAEPLAQIARFAPRQVLTLGRAVSTADFAAFAASAAAPNRTRTVWAWDDARQRAAVTVYVAGDAGVRADVSESLASVGDPLRPVSIRPAQAVPVGIALALRVAPGYETDPIVAAVTDALAGEAGLFSADRLGIGQPLFTSAIDAAAQSVAGVVAVMSLAMARIAADGSEVALAGALHVPEEDQWFDLADRVSISCEVANG